MSISLAQLDTSKASEVPFEFNLLDESGSDTGVILKIIGSSAEKVKSEVKKTLNQVRQKAAMRQASRQAGKTVVEYTTIEEDIEIEVRLSAVRVVGWNLSEECNADNIDKLCRMSAFYRDQIVGNSNNLSNFMKL